VKPRIAVAMIAVAVATSGLRAQTVPESSQAAGVEPGYRRTPGFRIDPFSHLRIPHWGFVISVGATAANNSMNLDDFGALLLLSDEDSLRWVDALDALGLVPRGAGLEGNGEAQSGIYVGGPVGSRINIGLSVMGRGYGAVSLDDDAVALLRDGNASREEFTLGDSNGRGIATGEVGVHALYRLGPFGSIDGVHIIVGMGTRYIRPLLYGSARSVLDNGGFLRLTGDTIAASIEIETLQTEGLSDGDIGINDGGGFVADFLVRAEWPTSGFAVEAMVANVGAVSVANVERRTATVELETTDLDEVADVLDTLDLAVQDVTNITVTLPRFARFTASAWANRIVQLDLIATYPFGSDFDLPPTVDLWSSWRLIASVPLRAGLAFGGHQGVGFGAGLGVETRNFFFNLAGRSLGGLFGGATGASARFDLGVFF
jgi:hypothetical protein